MSIALFLAVAAVSPFAVVWGDLGAFGGGCCFGDLCCLGGGFVDFLLAGGGGRQTLSGGALTLRLRLTESTEW